MPRIHITPVVLNLIIINALVFIAFQIYPDFMNPYFHAVKSDLIFSRPNWIWPHGEPVVFKPVQLLTAFFSHQAIWHIFMNMFALFSFGVMLETVMGPIRFLISYLTIGLVSTAIVVFLDPDPNPVLGASGALFGMMVLYAWYFPKTEVGLMFLPMRFNIRKFMIGAAVLSAILIVVGIFNTNVGFISHFGHLSGMVVGFVYLHIGRLRTMKRN
jgi:membrane associated rhomboid family serine protease